MENKNTEIVDKVNLLTDKLGFHSCLPYSLLRGHMEMGHKGRVVQCIFGCHKQIQIGSQDLWHILVRILL